MLARSEPLAKGIEKTSLGLGKEPSISMHAWDEIIKPIEQEADPAKLGELAKKLNDAMV